MCAGDVLVIKNYYARLELYNESGLLTTIMTTGMKGRQNVVRLVDARVRQITNQFICMITQL